jgi:hypothetical protein
VSFCLTFKGITDPVPVLQSDHRVIALQSYRDAHPPFQITSPPVETQHLASFLSSKNITNIE